MSRVPLLQAFQDWYCPNCPAQHVTHLAQPHAPFHQCPGLRGILAPYALAGTRCKVEAMTREDYVNGERGLRYDDDGRPVMAVLTVRDEGQDCTVYPGTATVRRNQAT